MRCFLVLYLVFIAFSPLSYSNELYGFCFRRDISLATVRNYLIPIMLPKDKIFDRESLNCLEMELSSARKQLFEKYLSRRFRLIRTYSTASKNQKETFLNTPNIIKNCQIEITKTSRAKGKKQDYGFGRKNVMKIDKAKSSLVSKSNLLLGAGLPGHLDVNGERVEITCWPKSANNYEIKISLTSNVDERNQQQSLSSFVSVRKGQAINLGNIVQDISDKRRNISIQDGINFQKKKEKSLFKIELVIR